MPATISRAVLATLLDRAAASPGREICGLMLGEGNRIIEVSEAANVADDPARRFEIDPAVLIAAHRTARAGGYTILGHYHSHPSGDIAPSSCDADMAIEDGILWLICSPDGSYALWRTGIGGLHGRFTEEQLIVGEEEAMPLASPPSWRQ